MKIVFGKHVKVGFLSPFDSSDPALLSGMSYSMRRALEAQGCQIFPFFPEENRRRLGEVGRTRIAPFVPRTIKDAFKRVLSISPASTLGHTSDEEAYRRTRDIASRQSQEIQRRVRGQGLDVLCGGSISHLIWKLDTEIPIIYFTDVTARLIFASYPYLQAQSAGYRTACDEIEQEALRRASMAVFATEWARASAIHDYGVPPERALVVPMGANIARDDLRPTTLAIELPTRGSIRLVMTASDPVRKQLDLAIDVVDVLVRQGWAAQLELIGPPTNRATAHPNVQCLGQLSMATEGGRQQSVAALRRSHLMILPSLGEAFGIAPCEAALVGKPSIVSDAGGLPEVVQHDVTGIVMKVGSTAEDYAREIIRLAEQPDRYRAMAAAAATRARANFTWERWGERLMEIMERARTAKKR